MLFDLGLKMLNFERKRGVWVFKCMMPEDPAKAALLDEISAEQRKALAAGLMAGTAATAFFGGGDG